MRSIVSFYRSNFFCFNISHKYEKIISLRRLENEVIKLYMGDAVALDLTPIQIKN